jgi:anti-anti-sigma factor
MSRNRNGWLFIRQVWTDNPDWRFIGEEASEGKKGMSVYTLTRIRVEPASADRALRLAVRLGHRLERQRGFLSLQFYRAEGDAGAYFAVSEWDSGTSRERVVREPAVAQLLAQAEGICEMEPHAPLSPLFHVHFPRRACSVAIARLARAHSDATEAMRAADKEAALKAMALPGSVGVFGGQVGDDPRLAFCRLEFDGEETLRRYRTSAPLGQWRDAGERTLEWSSWWRRVARMEYWRVDTSRELGDEEPQAALAGNLCLEIETSPADGAATLRFHGRMDADATGRFLKVRDALISGGCHRLTLDVSDLGYIASAALQALLETARQLKEAGGHLTLIDNEGRFNRIVRMLQLERSLAVHGGMRPLS